MKSKPHGFFPFYFFLICQVMAITEGNQQIISNTTLFSKLLMHYIYFVS